MKKLLTVVLCLMLALCAMPAFAAQEPATLVLRGGAVYTMDAAETVVTAVAARDGEIVYVGDDAGAEAFIGADTEVIELEGRMVTPGFIPGHDHVASAEYSARTSLVMPPYDNLDGYKADMKAYAEANPTLEAIIGGSIDLKAFGDVIPNSQFVTEALPDVPAVINDISGHGTFLNQCAMDLLGITDDIEEIPGSTVYRYEDGTITGYFSDYSGISGDIQSPEFPDEVYIEAFKEYQTTANSYGITSINDGGNDPHTMQVLSDFSKTGEMFMRVQLPLFWTDQFSREAGEAAVEVLDGLQNLNSDMIRIGQVKTIIDGVPEGKSALLLEPYAETAGMGDSFYGPNYCTQEEMNDLVAAIDKAGYQVLIHSMGDGGVHISAVAMANAAEVNGTTDNRHVIIHCTLMSDEDIALCGKYGIFGNTQPVWFYVEPQFGALELQMFGEERFYNEYNIRTRMAGGVRITGGSDYPVTPDFRPLSGIECGVTQGSPYPGEQGDPAFVRNAEETVSVMDMLKVYTNNGALQARMEDMVGSLEVGKKADMVVLEQDITKCDPLDIAETKINYTIFDGGIVYEG